MTPFTVAGWGRAQGPRTVTNTELEATLDTTDEWIRERTGIESRFLGGTTTGLATEAGRAAMARAGVAPTEIDVVIVATSTAEQAFPGVATAVAAELGIGGGTLDLNAACAGFTYAVITAAGWLAGGATHALVIGADAMSQVTDASDRSTAVIFADGAGAVVLRAGGAGGLVSWDAGTDATQRDILDCPLGGPIHMEGQAVFRVAVRAAIASIRAALERGDLTSGDVDHFVPHQANQRITDAIARRLGWADDQTISVVATTGNSSAGTVPWALAAAADDGRLTSGETVVACGFGAGMTWATSVIRWVTA